MGSGGIVVGPLGFEPRIANAPGRGNGQIDWEAFREWLLRNHKATVTRDYVNYSKRFSHCLLSRDLTEVRNLRVTIRANVVKAISSLAKFLGIYDEYKTLLKSYGIDWKGRSSDDLMIDRLTKSQNPDEMFSWISQVKRDLPELSEFMDFISVTGLRLAEAVSSYNLIVDLSKKGKLGEYYNADSLILEHFRFKETFIRNSKKAFVSFVPVELVKRISESNELPSKFCLQLRVKRHGSSKIRFADIREVHASFMTKYLKPQEIDFLHGRIGTSVFMANYYNPNWVGDLRARAIQGVGEIMGKIQT